MQSERGDTLECCVDRLGLLPKLLLNVDVSATVCLRFIDFYGNTIFNGAQCAVLVRELELLRAQLDEPTGAFVDTVIAFANRVASQVHLYLKFEGD